MNVPKDHMRFFDSRAAYMMFARSTNEKESVAARVGRELSQVTPGERSLRIFDAGMGDGSVLAQLMSELHQSFTHIPWLVVGKEISIEDVRQALERIPDRLAEHPELVFVVTNMRYSEAPTLTPTELPSEGITWRDVPLQGSAAHDFAQQIRALYPTLTHDWEVRTSEVTRNPLYVRPSVLVLYRQDREFLLRPVVPKPGEGVSSYNLVIASQTYRARTSAERKAQMVLAPLAKALGAGGRLVGVHSLGDDPGLQIIRGVWPGEDPFQTTRHELMKVVATELDDDEFLLEAGSDEESVFRFHLHSMPTEEREHIGTPSILAAWNAAAYVAQIDERRLSDATASGAYIEPTAEVLREHDGLWFNNESYVISRRSGP